MNHHSAARSRERPTRPGNRLGTAVCAATLTLISLATGYFAYIAYAIEPTGPWDHDAVTGSHLAAGLALPGSVLLALLTWATVKARWLRAWWYAIPAALALSALLRLTLLAPGL